MSRPIRVLFVAHDAYRAGGTIFLLNRTRFGYFVAVAFGLAALFSFLAANRYAREGDPASPGIIAAVVLVTLVAGVAVAVATGLRRGAMAQVAAGVLVPGSILAALMAFTVPLAGPGFLLDPSNGAPIGAALGWRACTLISTTRPHSAGASVRSVAR